MLTVWIGYKQLKQIDMILKLIYVTFFSIMLVIYITNVTIPTLQKNDFKSLGRGVILRTLFLPIVFTSILVQKAMEIINYYMN